MSAPRLKTHTLGCKVNQYETELVCEALTKIGYFIARPNEAADLVVVNTCTVTSEGDSKSRQVIRRLARENPGAKVIVMGCYATRAPEELRVLPNVSEVVTDKRELADVFGRFGVIDFPRGISNFSNRHRAYVKVQDGCLLRCSYCVIPQVRPHVSSRPIRDILNEVQRLVGNGHREIVLTGIHLGHYGVDWNWNKSKKDWIRLSDLLRELMLLEGEFRIRMSSLEATEITRELINILADYDGRICPHLHICLQSGSDALLRRMKRRWGTKRFLDRCGLVRSKLDEPALTTDVIVGFPGETEKDFSSTCEVVRAAGFSKIHIFPFSARRGTVAAKMPDQIAPQIKSDRIARLAEIEQDLRREYLDRLIGRRLEVLVEGDDPSARQLFGTSCRYAPVRFGGTEQAFGKISSVDITSRDGAQLLGNRPQCDAALSS